MARGQKKQEGEIAFDFCLNTGNFVAQSNDLINGRQTLKLNSAKLIRAAIMQIKYEDTELKPYIISIAELSTLLNISKSNIYRDIDEITNDILKNPVYIKEEKYGSNGKTVRWIKMPWCVRCEYQSDVGVLIKLNDELKPLLLNLKHHYTQYVFDVIIKMKSVYAIRLYELLMSKIMSNSIPLKGIDIELSLEEIRDCCGCNEKSYDAFCNLRNRVIDKGIKEIEKNTLIVITYDYIKKGKAITGLNFHFNMSYHIAYMKFHPEEVIKPPPKIT